MSWNVWIWLSMLSFFPPERSSRVSWPAASWTTSRCVSPEMTRSRRRIPPQQFDPNTSNTTCCLTANTSLKSCSDRAVTSTSAGKTDNNNNNNNNSVVTFILTLKVTLWCLLFFPYLLTSTKHHCIVFWLHSGYLYFYPITSYLIRIYRFNFSLWAEIWYSILHFMCALKTGSVFIHYFY